MLPQATQLVKSPWLATPATTRQPAFIAAILAIGEIAPYQLGALDAEKGEDRCAASYFQDAAEIADYNRGYDAALRDSELDAYLDEMLAKPFLTDCVPMSPYRMADSTPDWAAFLVAAHAAEEAETCSPLGS